MVYEFAVENECEINFSYRIVMANANATDHSVPKDTKAVVLTILNTNTFVLFF